MQGKPVSEILWCDQGDHAFSANDPDRTTWTEGVSQRDMQAGIRGRRMDTCGPCKLKQTEDRVRLALTPAKAEKSDK